MSGLIDHLSLATRSLQVQQSAMEVVGQNIANVNTPGYSRRVVDLEEVPTRFGGGVDVEGVRGIRDRLLERRLLLEQPAAARDAAVAEALSVVETMLGRPGESIDGSLAAFFDSFAALADNPTSPVARHSAQASGQAVAASFNELATRLESARRDADFRVRGTVDQINALAGQIASINDSLPAARQNGSSLTLEDQQAELVRQLSELIDVHVIPRENGGADVTFGSGRPLVIAENVYPIAATSGAPAGYAVLSSEGTAVTSEITGGRLAGLLHVRDVAIPAYEARLDTLAADVAQQVNALHTTGFDLQGVAGIDFFTFSPPPVGSVGAAAAIQVNSAIVSDASLIAAAGVAVAGDNQVSRAIAGLSGARVLNGGTETLVESWSELVYLVGSDSRASADSRDSRREIVGQVEALRDQVAGVSLDEEALNMLKFQRAYEANARFFVAADRMLQTLLQALGDR